MLEVYLIFSLLAAGTRAGFADALQAVVGNNGANYVTEVVR